MTGAVQIAATDGLRSRSWRCGRRLKWVNKMTAYKSKGRTLNEALLQRDFDPLAKYYLQWRQNCLDSIKWLAGLDDDTQIICTYSDDKIEWLVDYYEQKAVLHYCSALRAGVV